VSFGRRERFDDLRGETGDSGLDVEIRAGPHEPRRAVECLHFSRVATVVKADDHADPVEVGLFGARRSVQSAEGVPHSLEEGHDEGIDAGHGEVARVVSLFSMRGRWVRRGGEVLPAGSGAVGVDHGASHDGIGPQRSTRNHGIGPQRSTRNHGIGSQCDLERDVELNRCAVARSERASLAVSCGR
jgi:hypothetical protein